MHFCLTQNFSPKLQIVTSKSFARSILFLRKKLYKSTTFKKYITRSRYDVAISFAGPNRALAEELAKHLASRGVRVFYDRYEEATLWGKNLYDHLQDIYQRLARYCLILVSKSYARHVWTNHGRKAAQARAIKTKGEYLLPVMIDDI